MRPLSAIVEFLTRASWPRCFSNEVVGGPPTAVLPLIRSAAVIVRRAYSRPRGPALARRSAARPEQQGDSNGTPHRMGGGDRVARVDQWCRSTNKPAVAAVGDRSASRDGGGANRWRMGRQAGHLGCWRESNAAAGNALCDARGPIIGGEPCGIDRRFARRACPFVDGDGCDQAKLIADQS